MLEIGFDALPSILATSSQRDARSVLAELEEHTRKRLSLKEKADSSWFDNAAATILSQRSARCADIQAEISLLLVHWYYKRGEPDVAIPLARKATSLARSINAPGLLRRALSVEGVLLSRKLELAAAMSRLAEALQIAIQIGDRVAQCIALVNLAEARFNAGLLHESLTINRHVLRVVGDDPDRDTIRAAAHHNIAVASLTLSDLDAALLHARAAIDIFAEPRSVVSAFQLVVMHCTYARTLFLANQRESARSELEQARHWSSQLDSRPARVQVELTEVLRAASERRKDAASEGLDLLRADIKPCESAFRDLLEIELLCEQQLGIECSPSVHRRNYLSHLAHWQRRTAIGEIAAIQRATHAKRQGAAYHGASTAANEPQIQKASANFDRLNELASIAELREDRSREHPIRVARLAYLVAREIGRDERQAEIIGSAARLHDIGKLAVPDVVLLKRGKLDDIDFKVIQRHTIEGCQMLSDIIASGERMAGFRRRREYEILQVASQIALEHHERWNGSGYPRRLHGEQIHEAARITAVCEAFDCITHRRPYRDARTVEQSLAEIRELAENHFDTIMVHALVRTIQKGRWQVLARGDSSPLSFTSFAEADELIQRILQSAGENDELLH